MTRREIEEREAVYLRAGYRCEVCGKPVMLGQGQIAHCIADTKLNNSKYGYFFIQHRLNYKCVCSLACNQSCNIGNNPAKVLDKLIEIILYETRKFNSETAEEIVKDER